MSELEKKDLDIHLHMALQSVTEVINEKGKLPMAEVSSNFSHAVQCMVELRNRVIDCSCEDGLPDSLSLDRVNALISLMASIEYPLAGIHWPRIQQVHDGLQQMLRA